MGKAQGVRQPEEFGLVVIDPVRAFTDPTGRIGRTFPEQFSEIVDAVDRIASFTRAHAGPKIWVTSLYTPCQFSGEDLDHPFAQLCTDPASDDCAWDPLLIPPVDALVVTKTTNDAGSSTDFVDATETMAGEVDALLVTGFHLSACVAATALSCAQRFDGRVPVVLPLSLAATRRNLYDPADEHPADLDVTEQLQRLRNHGVVVCDVPEVWRNEQAADAV